MTVNLAIVTKTLRITATDGVVVREFFRNPKKVQFLINGANLNIKEMEGEGAFSLNLLLTDCSVSGVAVTDNADFKTKLGAIINF